MSSDLMTSFIYSYKVLPCVPSYANIFMGQFESKILSSSLAPRLWKRYIDDIFLVWTDTEESLQQFI